MHAGSRSRVGAGCGRSTHVRHPQAHRSGHRHNRGQHGSLVSVSYIHRFTTRGIAVACLQAVVYPLPRSRRRVAALLDIRAATQAWQPRSATDLRDHLVTAAACAGPLGRPGDLEHGGPMPGAGPSARLFESVQGHHGAPARAAGLDHPVLRGLAFRRQGRIQDEAFGRLHRPRVSAAVHAQGQAAVSRPAGCRAGWRWAAAGSPARSRPPG